jgi:hypothetical protein
LSNKPETDSDNIDNVDDFLNAFANTDFIEPVDDSDFDPAAIEAIDEESAKDQSSDTNIRVFCKDCGSVCSAKMWCLFNCDCGSSFYVGSFGVPQSWLRRLVTVEEAESENTHDGVHFGFSNAEWAALKARMVDGDEIWEFCSPPESWEFDAGEAGFALVRQGIGVDRIVTVMN